MMSLPVLLGGVSPDACEPNSLKKSIEPDACDPQSLNFAIEAYMGNLSHKKKENQRRLRLLAVHGRASNSQVSKMQMANLGLSLLFDIDYVDAPLPCDAASTDNMLGISGPFFNWLPDDPSFNDVSVAVDWVADKASKFDIIFGFSQGAALALAAALRLEARGYHKPACLCVCPAGVRLLEMLQLRHMSVDAMFCMGIKDSFKNESEKMLAFLSPRAATIYMDSSHEVTKAAGGDVSLHAHLSDWFARLRPEVSFPCPDSLCLATSFAAPDVNGGELRKVSLQSEPDGGSQMVQWTRAFSWFDADVTSITELLNRQTQDSIAIWDGNEQVGTPATYAQLLSFIQGEGNLHKFGVGRGDLVSYIVEEGPMSAVMFVVVTSHCDAAPLGASSTEEDLQAAFLQLSVKMVIASHSLEKSVGRAVEKTISDGCCEFGLQLVEATDDFAGSFSFCLETLGSAASHLESVNGTAASHLILRTSGTTSKPKVVPLNMKSVVANGCGIAKSLGLTCEDICINAMPLFHIGGLSASILATLASGGSVICMPGFQPDAFAKMLCRSPDPQPTWYSAVPTIHLAVMHHVQQDSDSIVHSLRFIRSGAAALSSQSAEDMRQFWGCPVLPTYSMTEQMPISQPPVGYNLSRPGSVGLPMVTVAIVDHSLRPLPVCPADGDQGKFIGEICISGATVMQGYANNDEANSKSFFFMAGEKYFRTGDVGFLDCDGYLHLTGREKELIKVGGEQVSPFVIEDVLYSHHCVQIALAFGIPHELLGEAVAAAVVLKESALDSDKDKITTELKQLFLNKGFPVNQLPRICLISEEKLVRTATGKINRKATRDELLTSVVNMSTIQQQRAENDSSISSALDDATLGIRFFLSIIVCLNHVGNHAWPFEGGAEPWSSAVTSVRTIGDIGVVCFGMLAGMMMAVSVKEPIQKGGYMKFFESRLVPIHLTYLIATMVCSVNRLFMCPPSRFEPYTYGSLEVCRATALGWSWSGTWSASLFLAVFTLQAWPVGVFVWHISYYTWFSSAYQFCVFCFPFIHRILLRSTQSGLCRLSCYHFAVHVVHYLTLVFMESIYLSVRFTSPEFANYFIYAGYMFPPFWAVRFACGVLLGLTFLKYHAQPAQKSSACHWAVITDFLTLLLFAAYALLISFQVESKHRISTVSLLEDRMYCGVIPRLLTPFFSVWLYGLAVGRGYTAWICRRHFLVSVLSPASYSIYLFHQPIFEWYSLLKSGHWWSKRKPGFEWFSPDPVELGFLDTVAVILLTIVFSLFLTYIANTYLMGRWLSLVRWMTCRRRAIGAHDFAELVLDAIEDLTGIRAELTDHLQNTGLASLGIAALVSTLNRSKTGKLTAADLAGCETVKDVVFVVSKKTLANRKVEHLCEEV